MEAKWTIPKLIGFACSLVFLAAVSFHGADGTEAAERQQVQSADSLSKVGLSARGKLIEKRTDSLSNTLTGSVQVPVVRTNADTTALTEASPIKQKTMLAQTTRKEPTTDKANSLLEAGMIPAPRRRPSGTARRLTTRSAIPPTVWTISASASSTVRRIMTTGLITRPPAMAK